MDASFISVIEKIAQHPDFSFCDGENERSGKNPHLCVYKKGEFVGKIRFADSDGRFSPSIDESVIISIEET